MARFPQSTVGGQIFTIHLDEDTRKKANDAGRIGLEKEQWDRVEEACNNLILWSMLEHEYPSAGQMVKLIQKVQKSAHRLNDAFGQLGSPPSTQAKDEARLILAACLREYDVSPDDVLKTIGTLVRASKNAEAEIKEKGVSKSGPPVSEAKLNFIRKISEVFEEAGGNATSNFSPNRAEGREPGGPFVRFLFAISEALPSEYRLASTQKTLGNSVRNYLRNPKHKKGKSASKKR